MDVTRRATLIAMAAGAAPAAPAVPATQGEDGPRLAELVAIEEIKQLKARYFRAVDAQDWAAFRAVFTDDAIYYRTDPSRVEASAVEEIAGGDRIIALVRERFQGAQSLHLGFMPIIEILSARTARGSWSMEDRVDWPDRALHGLGYYQETYAKGADGSWRIASFRLDRVRVEVRPVTTPVAPAGDGR